MILQKKTLSFICLLATATFSLIQCPHSKVEESFNLQATHDLYYYGVGPAIQSAQNDFRSINDPLLAVYDHIHYPGVVPRTFLGPFIISRILMLLSMILKPFVNLDHHPLVLQSMSRAILLLFNLHAHWRLANAAEMKYENNTKKSVLGMYMFLITASQFHVPYYASRMLPNTFSLVLVTHSYADWLQSKVQRSIVWMTIGAFVFRCDVLILLTTFGVTLLLRREIGIVQGIKTGLITVILSLMLTIPLDSIMWHRFLWPEGEVLLFNTIQNKSSDYGVSPWHWYWSAALPKGLLLSLFLIPLSFIRMTSGRSIMELGTKDLELEVLTYFLPIAAFIGLYSFLPHKEIRFIFIAFPMLNLFAAKGMGNMHHAFEIAFDEKSWRKKEKSYTNTKSKVMLGFLYFGGIFAIVLSCMASMAFVQVSKLNYPGGVALRLLSKEVEKPLEATQSATADIYIDVASAMTGVSLFEQRSLLSKCSENRYCNISKGGYENDHVFHESMKNYNFDYILSEQSNVEGYEIISAAKGHPYMNWRSMKIESKDAIFVHKQSQHSPKSA